MRLCKEPYLIIQKRSNSTPILPSPIPTGAVLNLPCRTIRAPNQNFSKAISLDPTHALAYQNLGILYFNQKDYNAAIEILEKALRNDVNEPRLLNNLGCYYLEKEATDKAIEKFNDCLKSKVKEMRPMQPLACLLDIFIKMTGKTPKNTLTRLRKLNRF